MERICKWTDAPDLELIHITVFITVVAAYICMIMMTAIATACIVGNIASAVKWILMRISRTTARAYLATILPDRNNEALNRANKTASELFDFILTCIFGILFSIFLAAYVGIIILVALSAASIAGYVFALITVLAIRVSEEIVAAIKC